MIRRVGMMLAGFAIIALLAWLAFYLIGLQHLPEFFWLIPPFFAVLAVAVGLIARHYLKAGKELSIGAILGIRMIFVGLIAVFVLVNMLADREHLVALTITSVVYAVVFSYFETRMLLLINKKTIKNKNSDAS